MLDGNRPALIDEITWQAVPHGLASNRQEPPIRRNAREASPPALMGFGSNGDRLTASQAAKGPKRYRYYVWADGESTPRVLAPELERTVLDCSVACFQDEGRVLDSIAETGDALVIRGALREASAAASDLQQSTSRIETIHRLVERMTVSLDKLRITVRARSLPGAAQTCIEVPVQLKRCGMAMRLVVGNGIARRLGKRMRGWWA